MATATRLLQFLTIGMAAAFLGGFVAVPLILLSTEGLVVPVEEPFAIVGALFLAIFGALFAVVVATMPATMLGGLLFSLHVRHRGIWAGLGAVAGGSCYLVAGLLPTDVGDVVRSLSSPDPARLVPAFAVAGSVAALFFQRLADLFLAFDDPDAIADA